MIRAGFNPRNIGHWRMIVSYDPSTGRFTWRVKIAKKIIAGTRAGSQRAADGYRRICAFGRFVYEHRLAWAFQKGAWPTRLIDHGDFDPSNNAWSNLRLASHSQNGQHRRITKNKTGFRGVSFHRQSNSFHAKLKSEGRTHCFGYHPTAEAAARAYNEKAEEIQGAFAVLNEVSL